MSTVTRAQQAQQTTTKAWNELTREPRGYWSMALYSLRHDWLTMTAIGVLCFLALISIAAPWICEHILHVDPNAVDAQNSFSPPYITAYIRWMIGLDHEGRAAKLLERSGGIPHWLGTDQLGRDQLARLLYGGRISLAIAFVASTITLVIGVSLGVIAGYYGRWVDDIIMWFINTMQSIPTIFLLLIVAAAFKPTATTLTVVLGFLGWMGASRLIRGEVLSVKQRDYVLAARAIGATNRRIMARHILPNAIPIIIILMAIDVGTLILVESALSFLGLGVQPPTATWGNMLTKAQSYFALGPWLVVFPGLFITLTVLSLYLIGDGLRDALDPMMKGHR
ncbi:MAG: ABC transporter permease [Anaerolineae bacterium]